MLTPASPADLPPLSELIAGDPFWRYSSAALAGEGVGPPARLGDRHHSPGPALAVTETGHGASVTESAGQIRAELAGRCGRRSLCSSHYLAPEAGGAESLDLVRVGADGSPHWTRVWPTPQDNPRRARSTGVRTRMAGRRPDSV